MKRILIISYNYFPRIAPRAFRWTQIAEAWVKQGIAVDVVCAWGPGLERYEVKNGVHIYRSGGQFLFAPRLLLDQFKQKKTAAGDKIIKSSANPSNSAKKSFFVRVLKWIYDHSWKKIYWPDFACWWYHSAWKCADQLVKKNAYNQLISVANPFTSHLAAAKVKKRHAALPLVLDYGDPFSFLAQAAINNITLYHRLNKKAEAAVLALADKIVVSTENAKDEYQRLFPGNEKKLVKTPHVLSVQLPAQSKPVFADKGKKKWVFVGTLYQDIRNPDFMLQIFSAWMQQTDFQDIELHIYGSIGDCRQIFDRYRQWQEKSLFLHGFVDRQAIIAVMSEADVLINIGNTSPFQVPTKILDYISVFRPVLNLIKIENDPSLDYLKSYPAVLHVREYHQIIDLDLLMKIRQFIINPPMIPQSIKDFYISAYRVDHIAKVYLL